MAQTKYNLIQISRGIIVPFLILAIGVAVYFLLLPKYKAMQAVKESFTLKQDELRKRQVELVRIKKLIADMSDKSAELALTDEAIPNAPRIPELLANIDYLTRQSGLLIEGLQISIAKTLSNLPTGSEVEQAQQTEKILSTTKKLGIMEVTLNLRGKFTNVKTFISNLEQNLRLMDVATMLFSEVDADSKLQEFTIKLQTYYQK